MRDQHHGAALFLLQPNDEIENRMGVFAIKVAGRFIGQQQSWLIRQAARDRDSLPFASGKFGREMSEPIL